MKRSMTFPGYLLVALSLTTGIVQAGPGEDTTRSLNDRYRNTARNCGADSMPAFLCRGVIIRATAAAKFWVPQEKNITSGAISASFLGKDARFPQLAWRRDNGFTLYPVLANPSPNKTYEVLCSFPSDAGTDGRAGQGCTDHSGSATVEDYCDLMGIKTAQEWVKRFGSTASNHVDLCAFDVRDRRNAFAGPAFMASIEARNLAGTSLFKLQNELRIATWKNNPPIEPPVESTFYTTPPSSETSGLENARANQIEWWLATRRYLPLVKLDLPQTMTADALFSYKPDDQAIQPTTGPNRCGKYFDSARFVDLPGSPGKKSLVVVPSACGREARDDQTNNFFNELVALYYRNPAWQGTSASNPQNILSMRRQLTCHFVYRRYAPEWTLEPHRPLIGIQESGAKQCDN